MPGAAFGARVRRRRPTSRCAAAPCTASRAARIPRRLVQSRCADAGAPAPKPPRRAAAPPPRPPRLPPPRAAPAARAASTAPRPRQRLASHRRAAAAAAGAGATGPSAAAASACRRQAAPSRCRPLAPRVHHLDRHRRGRLVLEPVVERRQRPALPVRVRRLEERRRGATRARALSCCTTGSSSRIQNARPWVATIRFVAIDHQVGDRRRPAG